VPGRTSGLLSDSGAGVVICLEQGANGLHMVQLSVVLCAGKVLATMRSCDANDVSMAVSNAREAFKSWCQLSGMQRGKLLTKASQIMRVSLLVYM